MVEYKINDQHSKVLNDHRRTTQDSRSNPPNFLTPIVFNIYQPDAVSLSIMSDSYNGYNFQGSINGNNNASSAMHGHVRLGHGVSGQAGLPYGVSGHAGLTHGVSIHTGLEQGVSEHGRLGRGMNGPSYLGGFHAQQHLESENHGFIQVGRKRFQIILKEIKDNTITGPRHQTNWTDHELSSSDIHRPISSKERDLKFMSAPESSRHREPIGVDPVENSRIPFKRAMEPFCPCYGSAANNPQDGTPIYDRHQYN